MLWIECAALSHTFADRHHGVACSEMNMLTVPGPGCLKIGSLLAQIYNSLSRMVLVIFTSCHLARLSGRVHIDHTLPVSAVDIVDIYSLRCSAASGSPVFWPRFLTAQWLFQLLQSSPTTSESSSLCLGTSKGSRWGFVIPPFY